MNNKIVVIIQAHMSSTRLPGKVLKPLAAKPALYRMIERVRQSSRIARIVIATSTMACDDVLEQYCREWGVDCYRGSDDDVLMRLVGAAEAFPADVYGRLTSDCPLICPKEIDIIIDAFFESGVRYCTHHPERHVNGTNIEIFTRELLFEAAEKSTERYEHEHVTPYMYWKQDSVHFCEQNIDTKKYRLTLDTPEDYALLCAVYGALYNEGNTFTLQSITDFLDAHPFINNINCHLCDKPIKE